MQGTTAQVISGGFTQALVEVQGLASSTRWLLGTTALLQGIVAILVGAAVISMCNGYLSKTTFRPVLVKWFTVTAAVIMVCGLGWQVTESIAGMQASVQVLGFDASQFRTDMTERADLRDIVGMPTPVYLEINLNFWPLWAGLGLFSVAQIFKRGLQMQKDTGRPDLVGIEESEGPSEIQCHLGALLEERAMTLVELSEMVNISVVNLSC